MSKIDDTTLKVKKLTEQKGFIYAFLMLVVRDCFYDRNHPEELEAREKLIVEELMFLLGLWLKKDSGWLDYPESLQQLCLMVENADEYMKELHMAFPERTATEVNLWHNQENRQPDFQLSEEAIADNIHEAIFYSGDYTYDIELCYFLEPKYRYDLDWLKKNKGFVPDEAAAIALSIKNKLTLQAQCLNFPDRTFNLKDWGFEIDDAFKRSLDLAQFIDLIPKEAYTKAGAEAQRATEKFCDSLINIFTVSQKDFMSIPGTKSFFENFSLSLSEERNNTLSKIGDYSILQENPIIQLSEDRYFIPVPYPVFASMYETPYYWINQDQHYRKVAGSHRGQAGEDIAYEFLVPLFGKDNTLRDIAIRDAKHKDITDIDVLCILGNKALCVQVKSKKLTQTSRNGTIEDLTKDFKGAVQDAYEQGLICRKHILERNGIEFWDKKNKRPIEVNSAVNEVYILCLTSENYPALTHQVNELLKKEEKDPYPIVFSIFDLRLITHYLNTPYEFMYYIRQRIATIGHYHATNEICFLAHHLTQKLYPNPDYKYEYLDTSLASKIDADYYPYLMGKEVPKKRNLKWNKWQNKEFELLCSTLCKDPNPHIIDAIFFLYDLSSESRDNLIHQLKYVKKKKL